MSPNGKSSLAQKNSEVWKFIKFSIAGVLSTLVEFAVYYAMIYGLFRNTPDESFTFLGLFTYENKGDMWAFLVSTTIGYAIAFVINRKTTFQANANPALSVFLYVLMVIFTIFATTWLGLELLDFARAHDQASLGNALAKPIVALLATAWTYPLNRFVIHRKKA